MKNPLLVIASSITLFVVAFFLDRLLPDQFSLFLHRAHTDKIFHLVAGYLLMAAGLGMIGIRDIPMLFLFVFVVGAGWEVFQHVLDTRGVVVHSEPPVLGAIEPYADLAADIAGAFLYWLLHLAKN